MSQILHNKISQLRQVKGVSKKKLKAREYNLRRKMGICFRCNSTNHTLKKCSEKLEKQDTNINTCFPHALETSHEIKELLSQQIIETSAENYDEKCNNVMNDMEVDKVDSILLDNLLTSLGPGPKQWSITEHSMFNDQQEKNPLLNGVIGNNCPALGITESQENNQDESNITSEIHNFAISIKATGLDLQFENKSDNSPFLDAFAIDTDIDTEKMSVNTDKCLPISYSFIDEKYIPIPLIIPRGFVNEKPEILVPKMKTSTKKIGRPKKSAIGIKPTK